MKQIIYFFIQLRMRFIAAQRERESGVRGKLLNLFNFISIQSSSSTLRIECERVCVRLRVYNL